MDMFSFAAWLPAGIRRWLGSRSATWERPAGDAVRTVMPRGGASRVSCGGGITLNQGRTPGATFADALQPNRDGGPGSANA
jgi:hypothetical protein